MSCKKLSLPEKWIIIGIPVLFLIGSFMHFLFDLSSENLFIGLIAPINESVWEHTKMVLLPVICWWVIYYLAAGKKNSIDKNKWFTGALAALLVSIITIPLLYYFYTEAFGVEVLAVDIGILFLALLFGQLLGLHFYNHSKGMSSIIPICIFIALILLYVVLTICPPDLPLFTDYSQRTIWID